MAISLATRMTREHLLSGNPLTVLEATVCFGCQSLHSNVDRLRKQGFRFATAHVPYSAVVARMRPAAEVTPPSLLDTDKVTFIEYRLAD
jgi:Helix-turn-helix domain